MKNLGNGVTNLESVALLYAISNLGEYRQGVSTMQKYYFPVRKLTMAVNNVDTLTEERVEGSELIR
ncbi:MAG: hypothetical protein IJA72_01470 [Clostridia bacterium]|nr:hypothetical protein [Clostridia bacterium]